MSEAVILLLILLWLGASDKSERPAAVEDGVEYARRLRREQAQAEEWWRQKKQQWRNALRAPECSRVSGRAS